MQNTFLSSCLLTRARDLIKFKPIHTRILSYAASFVKSVTNEWSFQPVYQGKLTLNSLRAHSISIIDTLNECQMLRSYSAVICVQLPYLNLSYWTSQRKHYAYSELYWFVFSRIRNGYGELLRNSSYLVQMQEIRTRKNSVDTPLDTFYTV